MLCLSPSLQFSVMRSERVSLDTPDVIIMVSWSSRRDLASVCSVFCNEPPTAKERNKQMNKQRTTDNPHTVYEANKKRSKQTVDNLSVSVAHKCVNYPKSEPQRSANNVHISHVTERPLEARGHPVSSMPMFRLHSASP